MKTIQLTATQLQLAQKLGISTSELVKQLAQVTDDTEEDNEDGYDNDPNKQEVMNAPIKALRDIWEVKFGARWVEVDSLDEEWDKIHGRLDQYDLFEEYDAGNWIKLKEQLENADH